MSDKISITQGQIASANPHCPQCNAKLDGFTGVNGVPPGVDDISICGYCQSVLQFNNDLSFRFADADAIAEVTLELSRMQRLAGLFKVAK